MSARRVVPRPRHRRGAAATRWMTVLAGGFLLGVMEFPALSPSWGSSPATGVELAGVILSDNQAVLLGD